MFCTKCGRQLADGEVCSCQQGQQQSNNTQYGYQNGRATTPALALLKKTLSSGLFLALAILYSVVVLFTFINALRPVDITETVYQLETALDININELLYDMGLELDTTQTSSFGMDTIISLIPSALICAGLWLLYANAKGKNGSTINPRGFTFERVSVIINMVLLCFVCVILVLIVAAVIMFASSGLSLELGGYTYELENPEIIVGIMGFLLVFILALLALMIVYYVKALTTIKAVTFTMMTGQPNDKISQFLIVMLYITGGIGALSGLTSLFTDFLSGINSLCSAAFAIIAAYMLSDYKRKIKGLSYDNGAMQYQAYQSYQPQQQAWQPSQQQTWQPQQQAWQQPQSQQPQPQQPQPQQQQPQQQSQTVTYTTCVQCGQQYPSSSAKCPKCGMQNGTQN